MCDACRNKAREFENSLDDRQREGFEAYLNEREAEERRAEFNLGYDEALADDDRVYERIVAMHERVMESWLKMRDMIDTTPMPECQVDESIVAGMAELDTLIRTLPKTLRGA